MSMRVVKSPGNIRKFAWRVITLSSVDRLWSRIGAQIGSKCMMKIGVNCAVCVTAAT